GHPHGLAGRDDDGTGLCRRHATIGTRAHRADVAVVRTFSRRRPALDRGPSADRHRLLTDRSIAGRRAADVRRTAPALYRSLLPRARRRTPAKGLAAATPRQSSAGFSGMPPRGP